MADDRLHRLRLFAILNKLAPDFLNASESNIAYSPPLYCSKKTAVLQDFIKYYVVRSIAKQTMFVKSETIVNTVKHKGFLTGC